MGNSDEPGPNSLCWSIHNIAGEDPLQVVLLKTDEFREGVYRVFPRKSDSSTWSADSTTRS